MAGSPDPSSGNWIYVFRVPVTDAGPFGYASETFVASTTVTAAGLGGRITSGPEPVTVAGLRGLEMSMAFEGERTGIPLERRSIALFGAEYSYSLNVEFDEARRNEMLEAWADMLATLELRDVPASEVAPEFDQQILTNFTNGPEPFVTGSRENNIRLSLVDNVYRVERLSRGVARSLGPFEIATQAVTIVVDVADATGMGPGDGFGVGCINDRDTGHFGYAATVVATGEFLVIKDSLEEPEILEMVKEPFSAGTETLRQIAITCTVDPYGEAQIAVAVNGAERARIAHSDTSITYFTAAELILGSEGAVIEVARVDAHSPRQTDPTFP